MIHALSKLLLISSVTLSTAYAASSGIEINAPEMNPQDQISLQRGAKYFMNYCSGCHSLEYMRFNRIGNDLGITDAQGNILEKMLQENLMFNTDKVGDTLNVAMSEEEGKKWFGVAPPDLTLEARLRGADWVYGFLTSFYTDLSAPWGVNNLVYPDVAMPNVLAALQGDQQPIYKVDQIHVDGGTMEQKTAVGVEPAQGGRLTPEAFDQMVYDIVNFLSYTADPGKIEREQLGVYVLLFLLIFIVFAFLLKREYWKDIH